MHAKNNDDVPFSQAEVLDNTMNKMMVKHELFTVQEGHSSQLTRNNPDAIDRIIIFINEHITQIQQDSSDKDSAVIKILINQTILK